MNASKNKESNLDDGEFHCNGCGNYYLSDDSKVKVCKSCKEASDTAAADYQDKPEVKLSKLRLSKLNVKRGLDGWAERKRLKSESLDFDLGS